MLYGEICDRLNQFEKLERVHIHTNWFGLRVSGRKPQIP
jgi:hypothetical protein